MSDPTAKCYTAIILGTCNHPQTYPFHNTTNGERGSYCADCGQKLPANAAPESEAIDIERELYLALKEITKKVQPPNGKCECPMCKAFAAIKLYEQKGKL